MSRAPQYRNICFTINANDVDEEPLLLLDLQHETCAHVRYCVYQRELAGHEHFQGYLELTSPKTFSALHDMEGFSSAHFEKRRGSAKQAAHYCIKPVVNCDCNICVAELLSPTFVEGPWVFGEISQQGQRAELLEIQRELNNGAPLKRISEDHFPEFVRFNKGFRDYARMHTVPRAFKSYTILFVGPSGTGKTRSASVLASMLGSVYKLPEKSTGFWCDDYDHQDVFFIDEMDGARMTPTMFNQLCDRYECVIPAHGGPGSQMVARYILITSNYLPKYWWKRRSVLQVAQCERRIDLIIPMIPLQVPRPLLVQPLPLLNFPPNFTCHFDVP